MNGCDDDIISGHSSGSPRKVNFPTRTFDYGPQLTKSMINTSTDVTTGVLMRSALVVLAPMRCEQSDIGITDRGSGGSGSTGKGVAKVPRDGLPAVAPDATTSAVHLACFSLL